MSLEGVGHAVFAQRRCQAARQFSAMRQRLTTMREPALMHGSSSHRQYFIAFGAPCEACPPLRPASEAS
jgi:hypothetical protein